MNLDPPPPRDPSRAPAPDRPEPRDSALSKLILSHPSGAVAEVYLQGAHVASWRSSGGEDVLFLSRQTRLEPGVPIRGGIPVVFPQFSDRGALPKHGFARTVPWEVVDDGSEAGGASARFRLADSQTTRELWPHPFLAELLVSLDEGLDTTLSIENTGDQPFTFTSALHTYYRVADVRTVSVHGLEGSRYLGVDPAGTPVAVREPLRIGGETDGVYAGVRDRLRITDPEANRTIVIDKEGFEDAVVWNPWIEKSRGLPDFGDDEYLTMICVEPANIAAPTRLSPGQRWSGTQRISVEVGS